MKDSVYKELEHVFHKFPTYCMKVLRCMNLLILFRIRKNWKESIIVPVHKKGDKADCINYRRTSLQSTSYKILSNILLSRLSLYIDEITEVINRSATD
jgi:hypothetical protein